jgi:hypothetical protein
MQAQGSLLCDYSNSVFSVQSLRSLITIPCAGVLVGKEVGEVMRSQIELRNDGKAALCKEPAFLSNFPSTLTVRRACFFFQPT